MLGAFDYKVISKVPYIVRNPGLRPYQSLKKTLIHLYNVRDNARFAQLLNVFEFGDRKPSELLSQMRFLLNTSGNQNAVLNKMLKKLFLDKLPPQVLIILAGPPQLSVKLTVLRADNILATRQYSQATNAISA